MPAETRQRSRPRFVVQELTGWKIAADGSGKRRLKTTTFYVLDLLDRARVVYEASTERPTARSVEIAKNRATRYAELLERKYGERFPDAG